MTFYYQDYLKVFYLIFQKTFILYKPYNKFGYKSFYYIAKI